jgi:hypothetical protein
MLGPPAVAGSARLQGAWRQRKVAGAPQMALAQATRMRGHANAAGISL